MIKKFIEKILWIFIVLMILFIVIHMTFLIKYQGSTFILVYHKIDKFKGGLKSIYVDPGTFDLQMEYLHSKGYKTISLEGLIDNINRKKIPEKVFVITFDDGYENNYTNAMPVLKKYNFRATVFVTAGYIGSTYTYKGQVPERHLNAKEIKLMDKYFDFGSHTFTHPYSANTKKEDFLLELSMSSKTVSGITGRPVRTFAYPFGDYNNEVKSWLKESGIVAACTTKPGLVRVSSDPLELPRFEFKQLESMSFRDIYKNSDFYIKTFFRL